MDNLDVVYAQYHEDIVLAALLRNVKKGFYIDVGANHEEYHSVTKYFYKKGWSGVNVEPIERLIKKFDKKRTRDINIQAVVSDTPGTVEFREYPNHDGLSTTDTESIKETGTKIDFLDYRVKSITLKEIFAKYAKNTRVDFIKIDVEGAEGAVVRSNDWKLFHPRVICIEANHRNSKDGWNKFLEKSGYSMAIFDGLNEYYLLNSEKQAMLSGFAEEAAKIAHRSIREHHAKAFKQEKKSILVKLEEYVHITEKQHSELVAISNNYADLSSKQHSIKYLSRRFFAELYLRLKNFF